MRTLVRRQAPILAIVLGGCLTVTLVCDLVTQAMFVASARRLLPVHFAGTLSDPAEQAFSIWLDNSQKTAGVAACIAMILLIRRITPAGKAGRALVGVWIADTILVVVTFGSAALAGVLLGAYGSRQLQVFLPYAPIEVAAWGLLLALYINTRRGREAWPEYALGLLTVEALLALAAILEAWL
jgi:hypothetical protein